MKFHLASLALLAVLPGALAGAIKPRASGTPQCTYTCPATSGDDALAEAFYTGEFTCEYLKKNQFYYLCGYDTTTGAFTGGDSADCPTGALASCTTVTKKRSALPVAKPQPAARTENWAKGVKLMEKAKRYAENL